jgi:hypothetical protein
MAQPLIAGERPEMAPSLGGRLPCRLSRTDRQRQGGYAAASRCIPEATSPSGSISKAFVPGLYNFCLWTLPAALPCQGARPAALGRAAKSTGYRPYHRGPWRLGALAGKER